MRYVDCCKSTRKNKKCSRKDGKHFSLQRRFTKKKCIKGPVKGFTMKASCAPYKFCKQKGGARKTRKLLPKLRKISYKNKKHHYKLKDPFSKRKLAIHEGVNREAKKTGKTKKKAAIAKKGRFNILRIYRKNKKIKECNTITHDMRYMDRKYGLGKTKNICGSRKKKGGKLDKSILNEELQVCSKDPMTGFTRDGYCRTNSNDSGSHLVCAKMDQQFLDYTKSKGNDLSSVVKDGENWCLCQDRWLQAHKVKKAPKVIKSATNSMIRDDVKTAIGQKGGGYIKVFSIFNDEFPEPISTDADGNRVKTMAWYGILVTPLKSGMAKMYMDQDFYNYFKWHPDKNEREYKRRVIKKILKALRNNLQQKNDKGVAYFGNNKFNIEQANFVLRQLKERNNVLKKILAPKEQQYISRLSPIRELEEKGGEDKAFRGGKRRRKTRKKKKQFLYNPDDPSKSFDVYIDKNPNDTIPIKYTTVKDVKDTIKKLERLYKTKKYPHKRIWQVGMIMKVRLEAMLKHKTKKYPNAKKVKQRFNLANKYFKFLGKRTKKKDFKSRKALTFKF